MRIALLILAFALAATNVGGSTTTSIGDPTFHEFALPTVEFAPGPIAVDPAGDVWFAAFAGQSIGELTATGKYRIIQLRDSPSQIQHLTVAADGLLWFSETFTRDGSYNRIGKVNADGTVVTYPMRRHYAWVGSLAPAAGGGVWVSEVWGQHVARVTNQGSIDEIALPGHPRDFVGSLVPDPDGSIWVAHGDAVAHVLRNGHVQRFVLRIPPEASAVCKIVRAGERSFWLTFCYQGRGYLGPGPAAIWRFTPPNQLSRYALANSRFGSAFCLESDRAGGAWLTQLDRNALTHIDSHGTISMHPIPIRGGDIMGIALDTLGDVWFTNFQSQKIGLFGGGSPGSQPIAAPLSEFEQEVVKVWRAQLQPRDGYDISAATPDTLSMVTNFAVVHWSDLNGDAATLLHKSPQGWRTIAVTNGNFSGPDGLKELRNAGIPRPAASQLLLDSNVRLLPEGSMSAGGPGRL